MRLSTILLFFISTVAHAIPVTWSLQDVVFDDGGTASGTFVFDFDTNTYSTIDINTTTGTTLSGTEYGFGNPNNPFIWPIQTQFVDAEGDLTNAQTLLLFFTEDLTNAGGSVAFNLGSSSSGGSVSLESLCGNNVCAGIGASRYMISGYVTSVPVPAAAWLFGSALVGLTWVRRKRWV